MYLENKKNHQWEERRPEKLSLATSLKGNNRSVNNSVSSRRKALPDFQAARGLHPREEEDEIRSEVKLSCSQATLLVAFCEDEEDGLSGLMVLLILDLDD